jgi:hypothetical protein
MAHCTKQLSKTCHTVVENAQKLVDDIGIVWDNYYVMQPASSVGCIKEQGIRRKEIGKD